MNENPSRWLDFYHKEKQEAVRKQIKKSSIIIATGVACSQRRFMMFEYDFKKRTPKCIAKGTNIEYFAMVEKARELGIDILQDAGFIESWFYKIKCGEKIPEKLYRYFVEIVKNRPYIMKMIYGKN